jgi:peroxiredoxin
MEPADFEALGPAIGSPFPDMTLVDQLGRTVDLHADRGVRPALLVFYRSARW